MAQAAANQLHHLQKKQSPSQQPPPPPLPLLAPVSSAAAAAAKNLGRMTNAAGSGERTQPTKAQLTMPAALQQASKARQAAAAAAAAAAAGNGPPFLPVCFLALFLCSSPVLNWRILTYVMCCQVPPPRLDLPPEESTDLEELEQFAKMFKQKRIKLGKLNF